ncbi:MAG: hypothetical protein K0V04_07485, partial [Deltaproteobacteria bacterium]|nr:hypothetical protein [Deltaproteobacteria bacterium]
MNRFPLAVAIALMVTASGCGRTEFEFSVGQVGSSGELPTSTTSGGVVTSSTSSSSGDVITTLDSTTSNTTSTTSGSSSEDSTTGPEGCDPEPWEGDLLLDSDGELMDYPGHTSITGNLIIFEISDSTDLSALECLRSVGGNLELRDNPGLERLDGLHNVEDVGGYLYLLNNSQLQSTQGLQSLQSTGDFVFVEGHPNLFQLSLPSLSNVGGRFRVWANP